MGKILINKSVACLAGVFLPLFASAALAEPSAPPSADVSALAANRKMKRVLNQAPAFPSTGVKTAELSDQDFLLKNYTDVAIATDLEPDDVLSLAILFEEANRIYGESPNAKYPIDLIVVGEGNTAIKRMRMEKLLREYFNIPSGVNIRVVEGRASEDNIFPYDGEELFGKETLEGIPFPELTQGKQAIEALNGWASQAKNPFIIQLKPAPELLYLDYEASKKTTILFYGSFNIRKTVLDPAILSDPRFTFDKLPTDPARFEAVLSHLLNRFSKIAILETFGVLGDQPAVCSEFEWTNKIGQIIANSDDPFIQMFRKLSSNWNAYIVEIFLDDCEQITNDLIREGGDVSDLFTEIHSDIVQLLKEWDKIRFDRLYGSISALASEMPNRLNGEAKRAWNALVRKLNITKTISGSVVQFTLADVLVAMATADRSHIFQAVPIRASYDRNGFLSPVSDLASNIVYYKMSDREKIASSLEQFLNRHIEGDVLRLAKPTEIAPQGATRRE